MVCGQLLRLMRGGVTMALISLYASQCGLLFYAENAEEQPQDDQSSDDESDTTVVLIAALVPSIAILLIIVTLSITAIVVAAIVSKSRRSANLGDSAGGQLKPVRNVAYETNASLICTSPNEAYSSSFHPGRVRERAADEILYEELDDN